MAGAPSRDAAKGETTKQRAHTHAHTHTLTQLLRRRRKSFIYRYLGNGEAMVQVQRCYFRYHGSWEEERRVKKDFYLIDKIFVCTREMFPYLCIGLTQIFMREGSCERKEKI